MNKKTRKQDTIKTVATKQPVNIEDSNKLKDSIEIKTKEVYRALANGKSYTNGDITIERNPLSEREEEDKEFRDEQTYMVNITNGNFTYTGCLNKDFERNGFGRNKYLNKDVYLGNWKKNKRNAQGLYIHSVDKDELQVYDGYWENGLKIKQGVYIWTKKLPSKEEKVPIDAYIGNFKNGIYSQGLYFSQQIEGNEIKRYYYLGNFNEDGKKFDDVAFYYLAHLKKLAYGKVDDDDLVEGVMMKVNDDEVSIDGNSIFHFEITEKGDYKTEDVLENKEIANLEEKAKEFLKLIKDKNFIFETLNFFTDLDKVSKELDKLEAFLDEESFAIKLKTLNSYGDITKPIIDWFNNKKIG